MYLHSGKANNGAGRRLDQFGWRVRARRFLRGDSHPFLDQEDAVLRDLDRLDQWAVTGLPLRYARIAIRHLALVRAGAR